MQTKEQERETLKRLEAYIKKHVDPDGYIHAALAGVLELAEDNIGNDFLISFPQKLETAHRNSNNDIMEYRKKLEELIHKVRELRESLAKTETDRDLTQNLLTGSQELAEELKKELDETRRKAETASEAQEKAQAEIIRLKARLFDLIETK